MNQNSYSNPAKQYWVAGKLRRLPPLNSVLPRRVDVRHDPRDFLVCLLGGCGFGTDCIAEKTGLSPGQVQYRLTKGNISRRDYRRGKSALARRILALAPTQIVPTLNHQLKSITEHAIV